MFLLKSWTFWFNLMLLILGFVISMPDEAKSFIIIGASANIFLRLKTQMKIEDENVSKN